MKRNARYAYNALKKVGAPVLRDGSSWSRNSEFEISAELYGHDDGYYPGHKDEAPNGFEWANLYEPSWAGPGEEFGVNVAIVEILNKYDLYSEWVNGGVLAVYDN